MKRVAYLTSQYPATSHTFIRREVEALRRKGLQLLTFSVRAPADNELSEEDDKLAARETKYVLPARAAKLAAAHSWAITRNPIRYISTFTLALKHRPPGMRSLLWSLFHFAESIVLARLMHADRISHVHNHFANSAATVGLLTTHYLELPWSLTLHGISETDYPAGLLLAAKLARAEFAACASWFGRAQAMRITPQNQWGKFKIVRCGIDQRKLPPRGAKRGKHLRIIAVGRLSAEKGQHGLLDAFGIVRAQGHMAELALVGDGPDYESLVGHATSLGLHDAVTFVGRLPETETLDAIAQSDLLVLPSFMEGLPVVLMEAMALRVPVIASRVAGIPELVVHNESGLLFTPSNWAELAALIIHAIDNPSDLERMAAVGESRVLREFDINKATEPLFHDYLRISS